MSIHGKGVGIYTKMSGSSAPSFVLADQGDPDFTQQFQVSYSKVGSDYYIGITPGYCQRVEATSGITSTGNRNVINGFSDIPADSSFGYLELYYIKEVAAYAGLKNDDIANDLELKQQYKALEDITYVFLYCPYPGSGVRLGVVGRNIYNSHFNYAGSNDTWGKTAVVQIRSGYDLTVTKNGAGLVTDVSLGYDQISYWERVGLLVKPLATFTKSTREIKVHNIGPQTFDHVSETYGIDVPLANVSTPPDITDGNWAAYYYLTGAPQAPSAYTFTAGTYVP